MAKVSMVNRELKRQKTAKKYAAKREALKAIRSRDGPTAIHIRPPSAMFGSILRSELYTAGGRIPSQQELHARAVARLIGTIALAAINALADAGELDPKQVERALTQLGIDVDKPNPMHV